MAGNSVNNGEHQPPVGNGNENGVVDGHFTSVTETENSNDPTYNPNVPKEPLDIPPLAVGAPMEQILASLVTAINRQGEIMREQNRRIEAVEESRITRASTSSYRQRASPSP
jgi:hypothetical protein